MLTTSC